MAVKEKEEDEILDPPDHRRKDSDEDEDKGSRRGRTITCDFCECKLTQGGERLTLSDRAKRLRKLDEEEKKETSEVTRLAEENANLKKQIEDLQKKPVEARRYPLK